MAEQPKSQDELDQILKGSPPVVPVNAPQLYASTTQLYISPTDFTFVLSQPRPVNIGSGNQMVQAATLEPVAILHMSPGAVKDLSVLLVSHLALYEANYGKLETEYTRKQAAEEAEAAKASKAK